MYSSATATISSIKTTISPNPKPTKKNPFFPFEKINLRSFSSFKSLKCIHSPPSNPKPSNYSPLTCTAVTFSPSHTTELVPSKLHHLITEFKSLSQPIDRVKRLLHYATLLSPLPDSSRVDSNRVMGCTALVWLEAQLDKYGKMMFWADSDSEITRGFCACLIWVLDGALPEEVLKVTTEDLAALNIGLHGGARSRVNTWHNVLVSMQKRVRILVAEGDGKKDFDPFPSLIVSSDGVQAKGSYDEAQARYLFPDESKVQEIVNVLKEKKIGVVSLSYMDPEVQGILTAAQKHWPHIHISDSLVMADSAVEMAEGGCKFITVLGVDFMSENVRATLDQAGFGEVCVYGMSNELSLVVL
ncbi:quinolinate synthase [Populus alba x Populus x berolinensis]|uniref:Quinolinate synthase n=1 Tax=Populus alba x Populus x berolinensis TaxID=444605 RepID=A0AAD6Q3J0_9ROSI|nr:quinolinate synthase [Populus alba x Populus x berolinensis]